MHFRPITIARDDGDVVEIEAGLSPGDRVALKYQRCSDGRREGDRGRFDAEGRGSVRSTGGGRRARRQRRRSRGIAYALRFPAISSAEQRVIGFAAIGSRKVMVALREHYPRR